MASNEHAFLSETNLHNPKGLSLAANHTVCSKGDEGALEWIEKQSLRVTAYSFSGYSTLIENYQYPEPMLNGQSPNEINKDYGSSTISSGTVVVQKKFFRIANSNNILPFSAEVGACTLQITSDDTNPFTVALVKYTPTPSSTTVYPIVMFEKSVTGIDEDTVISYDIAPGGWTSTSASSGDHLFLMVKADGEDGVGDKVHIVVALEFQKT